jgi:hypothetical protein
MDRPSVLNLSRDETLKQIDDVARQRLCMSASEMLRDYKAGRLVNPGAVADVLVLANLLAEDDPVFADR